MPFSSVHTSSTMPARRLQVLFSVIFSRVYSHAYPHSLANSFDRCQITNLINRRAAFGQAFIFSVASKACLLWQLLLLLWLKSKLLLQQQKGLSHDLKNVYAALPLPDVRSVAVQFLLPHELAIIKNAITANFI